ncbi:sugar ABC transporter substrate-binding protein [Sediminibacillus terrae]|uniref:sugar ABC transporter substrate-binding protein n=1 Tax=Sediminibacillus terrae TaxID=1562106 RepID=UPI0012948C69|nr:sugar ABC transporter substrate-binding protein [Sediminibacillus terrae]
MKQKKLGSLLVVMLAAVLVLGACSSNGSSGGSSDKDTITVWTMTPELEDFVKEYEDESGVKVEVQAIPWDNAHDKLLTAVASGKGPDVLQIGTTWVAEFAEAGTFLDLTDYIDEYPNFNPDNFYESAVETTKYDGQTIGIPWYVDTRVLYYRTDLLEEVGYPEGPETWEDVKDAATQLAARGDDQYGIEIPQVDQNFPFMLAWENGWQYEEGEGAANFEKTGFKEGVELHHTFFEEGMAQLTEGKQLYQAFSDGSKPMFFSGPWEINSINEQIPELEGQWDVHVMPEAENNKSMIGGAHWTVFNNTEKVDEALDFINWMADPETQVSWYDTVTELPANMEAWEDPELADDDKISTFGKQLESTQAVPVIPEFETMAQELIDTLEQINRNDADIDKALEEYRNQVSSILSK